MATASNIDADVVGYVEKSAKAMTAADTIIRQNAEDRLKAAGYSPTIVDHLVATGLITAEQRAMAAEKMASHAGAAEVLVHALHALSDAHASVKTAAAVSGASQGSLTGDPKATPAVKAAHVYGAPRGYGEDSSADREFSDRILGNARR